MRCVGFTFVESLVVVAVVLLLLAVALPAAAACGTNLRESGLGMTGCAEAHGVLPFGVGPGGDRPIERYSGPEARRDSVQRQSLPFPDRQAVCDAASFPRRPFHGGAHAYGLLARGPYATAATTVVGAFPCPADKDRLARVPWAKSSHRACGGGTPAARAGNDGPFGRIGAVRLGRGAQGPSQVAAVGERVRGDGRCGEVEKAADLLRVGPRETHGQLRHRRGGPDDAGAAGLWSVTQRRVAAGTVARRKPEALGQGLAATRPAPPRATADPFGSSARASGFHTLRQPAYRSTRTWRAAAPGWKATRTGPAATTPRRRTGGRASCG